MIPTRNKGTLADSHISKDTTKLSQSNIVGFIRLQTNKPIYYRVYHTTGSQANIHIKDQPSQLTDGIIRLQKRWKNWTAKLVSSTTELWKPALDWDWILKHLHTQHKEASPSLLHSPSGYAFHSSAIQGVQGKKPTPLYLLVRFLHSLGLSI